MSGLADSIASDAGRRARVFNAVHPSVSRHDTTVIDLIRWLRRRWLILPLLGLAGGLAGWFVAQSIPLRYEAVGVVRMAQVALLLGETVQLKPVEMPAQAAERVVMPGFLQASGLLQPGETVRDLQRKVVARTVRGTDLLEIRYRDRSVDAAASGLRKVFDFLRQRQDELAQPARQSIAQQLQTVQAFRRVGEGVATERPARMDAALALSFASRENDLLRWEASLQAAMAPPSTAPAALVEGVSVSDEPVGQARTLVTLAGVVAGLLLGLAVVLVQYVMFRRR